MQVVGPVVIGAFAGGLLQGFAGFGFAMVAVPLTGLFLSPLETLPYAMVLQALMGIVGLPGAVGACRWRLLGWLSVGAAIGSPLGFWIITLVTPKIGHLLVGLTVLAASGLIASGLKLHAQHERAAGVGAGLASGIMNGLAGMSGPPAVALLLGTHSEPRQVRATLLVFVFLAALFALAPFALLGKLHTGMILPLLPAGLALAGGMAIGSTLFNRTTAETHRRVALIALAVLGVVTVIAAVR